ncbi:hypothetical protein [Burkholderia phage FLC9]|nr:hypothetical protein [Burkholderia phage FLC9]
MHDQKRTPFGNRELTHPRLTYSGDEGWRLSQKACTTEIYDAIIIVTGSLNFNNYDLFVECLEERLLREDLVDLPLICFVTGRASKGADDMIIRWCRENGFPWAEFPADRDQGRSAEFARNAQTARVGTHLIAFWDGDSRVTRHMFKLCEKQGLAVTVNLVDPDPDWQERTTIPWQATAKPQKL